MIENLFFKVVGKGKPLICLHGYAMDHTIWLETAEMMKTKAKLILPDLPGHGKSPVPEGSYSMQSMAKSVLDLMDRSHIENACFAGHSMGGYVALAFAEYFPNRLSGLALVASHPFTDTEEKKKARYEDIARLQSESVSSVLSGLPEKLTKNANVAEYCRFLIERMDKKSVKGVLEGMAERPDRVAVMKSLDVPVMAIAGLEDQLITEMTYTLMQSEVRGLRLIEISNAGHMPMLESPVETSLALSKFINLLEEKKMKSKVYFTSVRTQPGINMYDKLDRLINKAGIASMDFKGKPVALKIHFGEPGNLAYIRPNYAARIVMKVKEMGGKPFLTDCNTLYYGQRSNAIDHLETAMLNGFNRIAVGCDVIIADGLTGGESREIPINMKRVEKAKIGSIIADSNIIISLNHFKGHEQAGFGGALKNIGMGCGSRKGKLEMHSASKPQMFEENCVACGMCIRNCPENAIAYNARHKAQIDYDKCIGCGQCVASCNYGSARAVYDQSVEILNEKIAEYAYAVLNGKQHFHISFILNVSPDCDCLNGNDQALVPDIGIAASFDPVALDMACVDMVNQAPAIKNSRLFDEVPYQAGEDKFVHVHTDIHWIDCLKHAEEIKLGSMAYNLIEVK